MHNLKFKLKLVYFSAQNDISNFAPKLLLQQGKWHTNCITQVHDLVSNIQHVNTFLLLR